MEHLVNTERFAQPAPAIEVRQTRGITMLLRAVEAFLKQYDMPATKFGRLAAHDPRFVLDLRMGRTPRRATEARTRGWMAEYEVAARKAARAAGRNAGDDVSDLRFSIPDPVFTDSPNHKAKHNTKELSHAA
ncbi:hypothetical protein AUC45_04655 [Erythrobacter sp. YT30]|nr:hypothetical protein AUC45_04655 [Erythrobacter sp. YT30]